jgi:agmatine deiminase
MNTPTQQGFSMPAEWERHSAVWLAWPFDKTTFTQGIKNAENTFCEILKALEGSEPVNLIVLDGEMEKHVRDLLNSLEVNIRNITFYQVEFADVWTRDYGPIFVTNQKNNQIAWTKWKYNALGKGSDPYFAPLLIDDSVFNKIAIPYQKFEPNIVLEGGAIDVNGIGICLTTEQTLLNKNRNADKSKYDMEKYLDEYLGVKKIIWLKQGLVNDHTDGHIDEVARFVGPNTIICAYEDDRQDENYKILDDNYQILKNATNTQGKAFDIIKLPMPHMNYNDGVKAPVSYCNFYIGNNIVLASVFNDKNDAKALQIIQNCFPKRKIVPIDCSNIIYGGGAVHCMTQQQPAV